MSTTDQIITTAVPLIRAGSTVEAIQIAVAALLALEWDVALDEVSVEVALSPSTGDYQIVGTVSFDESGETHSVTVTGNTNSVEVDDFGAGMEIGGSGT